MLRITKRDAREITPSAKNKFFWEKKSSKLPIPKNERRKTIRNPIVKSERFITRLLFTLLRSGTTGSRGFITRKIKYD